MTIFLLMCMCLRHLIRKTFNLNTITSRFLPSSLSGQTKNSSHSCIGVKTLLYTRGHLHTGQYKHEKHVLYYITTLLLLCTYQHPASTYLNTASMNPKNLMKVIKKNTYSRKCSEQKDQIMTLGEVKEEYCEDMQM